MTYENDVNTEVTENDVPFDIPEGYRLMSDDEATEMAKTLIEDHREKYEMQEVVDSAIAAGQLNDVMRNEFYYEYMHGGRKVQGLSASMIKHLATVRGISEVTEERVITESDEKWEYEVTVEMPDPLNPNRMMKRSGFAEATKIAFGKPDPFAKQKAHTKAFRNAALSLLPQDLIIATIYKLAKLVPVDWHPKALPAPKASNATTAMKRCFAVYGKHEKDILEKHGVTREEFGDAIRVHYEVGTRKDLTTEQWNELRKSLETEGYGNVVKSIIDIAKTTPF
ncbi:hypothetical protein F4212_08600 [Candidatus Poribacteria bacterium]|nr:hypothetical protein [Candidatus Poribacteria bacterium]